LLRPDDINRVKLHYVTGLAFLLALGLQYW
jgi:hypothetical protein